MNNSINNTPEIILKGINEFYPNLNNKTYNIYKINNEIKINFMCEYFKKFIQNQKNNPNEKHYLGIDFEFNKVSKTSRDVALMQINMENDSNIGNIFVFNPNELSKNSTQILINLLTFNSIIKILHGAESLDIPYLFDQLLVSNSNIDNFCQNFFDTKFLCDYNHLEKNIFAKCSIYHLLVEHNVMTQKKMDELNKIEERSGPIYLIHINIHSISNDVFKYSLYDVIYLPELVKKFLSKGKIYSNIIPEVSSLVNKFKRNVEKEFIQLETIINTLNINFLFELDKMILLKDCWEMYWYSMNNKYLIIIKQIPYFKTFFEIITKMIVYENLFKFYKIYFKKGQLTVQPNFNNYKIWIEKYTNLSTLFNDFNQQIQNHLNNTI